MDSRKQGKAPYVPILQFEKVLSCDFGRNTTRNRAILLVSYNLGLRAKEIASLRIGDICDLRTGQLVEVIRLLKHMTKGSKFRESYLTHDQTRVALNLYLNERGRHGSNRPLFLSQKGGAFSANTMQRLIASIWESGGIHASSHSGRRSFATRLLENGADIYAVMELMGHESISTTQGYLYASPERLRKIAALLNR